MLSCCSEHTRFSYNQERNCVFADAEAYPNLTPFWGDYKVLSLDRNCLNVIEKYWMDVRKWERIINIDRTEIEIILGLPEVCSQYDFNFLSTVSEHSISTHSSYND
jgi:hypothetical protein